MGELFVLICFEFLAVIPIVDTVFLGLIGKFTNGCLEYLGGEGDVSPGVF